MATELEIADRDERQKYATAALSGLVASGAANDSSTAEVARTAWRIADAMVDERKRREVEQVNTRG
jgi:hypothetical protein